ncbi:FadR/GntR family transcriptional regulator [Mailhella sp.]|uniref:FadR/GntR family transcriptional regulator n=1 Tax=Mailhella sp. TaxID=1981029 RepID=UPI0040648CE8
MSKQKIIEQKLEQALLEGRWKLFERLPSERLLAEEFSVNRTTLRAALSALVGQGILETIHGSGTRVRALPADHSAKCDIDDRIKASILLIPSIMHACSLVIKPSQIISLELILPVAGTALRNSDTKSFIQAQIQFFIEAARFIDNSSINAALVACLPEGKLVRLFSSCCLRDNEQVFSHLARILSALRHADAQEVSSATQAYFSALQALMEKK